MAPPSRPACSTSGWSSFITRASSWLRGSGPYFYLPKLESHLEAELWNDVFVAAQEGLGVPQGSIRATVLIETILAAFEMEEILYELRHHAAGLNAGRWDYIFSVIKKLRSRPDKILPDRAQVTMAVPFMRAYQQLLVATCHRRGAHAIGGMSAFIPNRREPEVTERALAAVREDKRREAGDGSDGTWVAHPDLVPVAGEIFDAALGERPNQKDHSPHGRAHRPRAAGRAHRGRCRDRGRRADQRVGRAAVPGLVAGRQRRGGHQQSHGGRGHRRDQPLAALAVARARGHAGRRRPMTAERYTAIRDEELGRLQESAPDYRWTDASALLDELVLSDDFVEFLTLPAYPQLG